MRSCSEVVRTLAARIVFIDVNGDVWLRGGTVNSRSMRLDDEWTGSTLTRAAHGLEEGRASAFCA